MKEENIVRANSIKTTLDDYRGKLYAMRQEEFGISMDIKNAPKNAFIPVKFLNEQAYEIIVMMIIQELVKRIDTLEKELADL